MRGQVSQEGEDVVVQLVAWETLGREEDPKLLLRQVSLSDLSILHLLVQDEELKKFVFSRLVEVEMLYRVGKLESDWAVRRSGRCVRLSYESPQVGQQSIDLSLSMVGAEA